MYLLPGMKSKFTVPDYYRGVGAKAVLQKDGTYKKVPLIKGFYVDDPEVGELTENADGGVIYTHKKYAQNKIYYFARTGERGEVHVISVPIHDHSSIVTGGPAYGTYFTDDETTEG